jgi:histidinol-phosphate phosphatase family protein
MNLSAYCFTKEWTLFLDRDGVVNRRIPGGYVTKWEEFVFIEGVKEALAILSKIFGTIILVSNQQGIAKGLMSVADLHVIDKMMKDDILQAGGRIDASYYSPHLDSAGHPDRKPGTGMALRAQADFPGIDFAKAVMAGDTHTDMEFGRKLGMVNVMIGENAETSPLADFHFDTLPAFAKSLNTENRH